MIAALSRPSTYDPSGQRRIWQYPFEIMCDIWEWTGADHALLQEVTYDNLCYYQERFAFCPGSSRDQTRLVRRPDPAVTLHWF